MNCAFPPQQIKQHPLYVPDDDCECIGVNAAPSPCTKLHSIDTENLLNSFNTRFASSCKQIIWTSDLVDKLISPLQRYLQGRVYGGPNDASLLLSASLRRNSKKMYPPKLHFNKSWYLEDQTYLQCWKHTLSSILGIILPADSFTSNWFTGLIASFIRLDGDHLASLDEPMGDIHSSGWRRVIAQGAEKDRVSFCESVAPNKALSKQDIQSSAVQYRGCLQVEEAHTAAYVGMTILTFHRLCCCINTDDCKPYIGCISVGSNKIKTFGDLREEMLNRNCNAAIVFVSLYKHRPSRMDKHYVSIWRVCDRSGEFYWNYFDPIHGMSKYVDRDPQFATSTNVFEDKPRSFFVFNLKFGDKVGLGGYYNHEFVQMVACNINSWTEHILVNYLRITEFGFENNCAFKLCSTPTTLRDEGSAVLGNLFIAVKSSGFYDRETGMKNVLLIILAFSLRLLFILSTGRKRSVGAFAAMDLQEGQVIDILETL